MFTGIHVDHAALDRASEDLVTSATTIESRLQELESELAPLRSGWSGQARESYTVAQRQWDAAMDEMVTLLHDFATAVREANDAYRSADRRGAQRFS